MTLRIDAKLHVPQLGPDVVPRTRLLGLREVVLQRKLTLVCAPAGFGKSVAATVWLHGDGDGGAARPRAAWYTIDPHDDTLAVFLGYLLDAIDRIRPGTCSESGKLLTLAQLPPVNYLYQALLSDLDKLTAPLLVVLDDYHHIKSDTIHQFMSGLLRYLPGTVHLILTVRTPPPLPLARLRANGELLEVLAADLAFEEAEAAALVAGVLGQPPAAEVVTALMAQTGGWPAGLRLVATAMQHASHPEQWVAIMQRQGHELMLDYLLEEVLNHLPPYLTGFLFKTSVLTYVHPELCDLLTGGVPPSAGILAQLALDQLFIQRLDTPDRAYRYHPQFQALLQTRLRTQVGPEGVARLHRAAAGWLAQRGHLEDAMRAYMAAGDAEYAADLFEQNRGEIYRREQHRQFSSVERLLALIPTQIVEERPVLLLTKFWLAHFHDQPALMLRLVNRAEELFQAGQQPQNPRLANALLAELIVAKGTARLGNAASVDATPPAEHIAALERAWQLLPVEHAQSRGFLMLLLTRLYRTQGRHDRVLELFDTVLHPQFSAVPQLTGLALNALAEHYLIRGQLTQARATGEAQLAFAESKGLVLIQGLAHMVLGILDCQQLRWDDLQPHLAYVRDNPYLTHYQFQLVLCFYTVRLALHHGRCAAEFLGHLRRLAWEMYNLEVLPVLDALDALAALLHQREVAAQAWVEATQPPPIHPTVPIGRWIWARCQLARGTKVGLAQAEAVAGELVQVFRTRHDLWNSLDAQVLLCMVYQAQGRISEALTLLTETVETAVPLGFRLFFTGYGDDLRVLLQRLAADPQRGAEATRLLALPEMGFDKAPADVTPPSPNSYRPSHPFGLYNPVLTPREEEVLQLLAQGLPNREIARRLVVSVNTARNHVSSLLEKLGAETRLEAVRQARTFGLLHD